MRVRQLQVGPMQNFVYLTWDEESSEAAAIDSGWETGPVVAAAKEEGLTVRYVIATHRHFDHSETLQELAGKLGATIVAHEESPVRCDVRVRNGETLDLGASRLTVMHTPGHTEDSICIYSGKNLFTGDTLFIGTCGRTDLPGGSVEKLYHSLHDVILHLPMETEVYPGHDYGEVAHRALGEEAKTNPALTPATLEEFAALFG